MQMHEITEAHEVENKDKALVNLAWIFQQWKYGEETFGVLEMYEHAARDMGATQEEITEVYTR